VQAVVQVSFKIPEEYLSGREQPSEALRNFFFEREEEVTFKNKKKKIKLWLLLRFEEVSPHL